jgi:hypothetical protein
MTKPATIFDHLANITFKKTSWDSLTEADQKSFSPYLINRWLSMNPDFIELVDMFQQYTIGPLDKKHVYQLYCDFLPKQKTFAKYIKGKKSTEYNKELVEFVATHYMISKRESEQCIDFWKENAPMELSQLLKKYGHSDAEIKKLLK